MSKVSLFNGKQPDPLQAYYSPLFTDIYPKTFIKDAKFRGSRVKKASRACGKKQVAHIKRGDRRCKGRGQDVEIYPINSFIHTTEMVG